MSNRFFWYELMTSDRPAAEAFYSEVVGWTLQPFGDPTDPYTIVEAGGRGVGGLMTIPAEAAAHGLQPCWVGYIHVTDIDAALPRVRAAGGSVHREPEMIPNVGRFAIVADPQGAIFNFLQPDGPGMPPVPMGTVGGVDWHELHSSDWAAGFAFYASLFGWSKTDAMEMGAMGTYQMIAQEPAPEGAASGVTSGAMFNDPGAARPYWLFYFHVDAIDAAGARITENGGKILHGPQEVPGGMWIVNAQDPQGAQFALVAPQR